MSQSILYEEIQNIQVPVYGKKYYHFTDQELAYIFSKYKGNCTKRFKNAKKFMVKYSDLSAFQERMNNEEIDEREFISIPIWYIFLLASFGRIDLSIKSLFQIRVQRKDFLPFVSLLPYVNQDLIKQFEYEAINSMRYSEIRISKAVTIDLIRYLVFCQSDIKATIEIISMVDDKEDSGRMKKHFGVIKNVLNNLGIIKAEMKSEPVVTFAGELLHNKSIEFRAAIEEYGLHLKSMSGIKQVRTEMSHLRRFFNFLYDAYADIQFFSEINNTHINAFVLSQMKEVNIQGKYNENSTINNRLQTLNKFLKYLEGEKDYHLMPNIITEYDSLLEIKKFTKYISEEQRTLLIEAVNNIDEKRYFQQKMALLIMLDTGRRKNEVLSLAFNCLSNGRLFFTKIKKGKRKSFIVGETTINAVLKLKEYARNIKLPLYSSFDELTIRRLFPSMSQRGVNILSDSAVEDCFEKAQVENGIVDENGKALFSIHDNKRFFVSSNLSKGMTSEELSLFLQQDINSLLPYEVNNEYALIALKRVESKKLLLGESISNEVKESNKIMELILDVNIRERNQQNLLIKLKRSHETFPLLLGSCTDVDNVDICGDLVCMACNEFRTYKLDEVYAFGKNIYKHIYKNIRHEEMEKVEETFLKAMRNVYINLNEKTEIEFSNIIKTIKKEVRRELKNE